MIWKCDLVEYELNSYPDCEVYNMYKPEWVK
jgi:hypothetical protein